MTDFHFVPLDVPSNWDASADGLPAYRKTGHCGENCGCPGDEDDEEVLTAENGRHSIEIGWIDEMFMCNVYSAKDWSHPLEAQEFDDVGEVKTWLEAAFVKYS